MNRFTKSLDKNHGKLLLTFRFNGRQYEVRCTEHSLSRFAERNLDIDGALGSIVALGKERLDKLSKGNEDVAIIDKVQHQTVIITFESEGSYTQIRIATIIDKDYIFVKEGTKIFSLYKK